MLTEINAADPGTSQAISQLMTQLQQSPMSPSSKPPWR